MSLIIREYINGQIRAEYRIPKVDGESSIGRSDNATYTIGGSFPKSIQGMISGVHATVRVEKGRVWIRDGNGKPSQYGIYKGSRKITDPEEVRENEIVTVFRFKDYREDVAYLVEFRFDCDTIPPKTDDTSTPGQILETILEQFQKLREDNDERFEHLEHNQEVMLKSISDLAGEVQLQKGENQQQAVQIELTKKIATTTRTIARVALVAILAIWIYAIANPTNKAQWENLLYTLLAGGTVLALGPSAIGKLDEKK